MIHNLKEGTNINIYKPTRIDYSSKQQVKGETWKQVFHNKETKSTDWETKLNLSSQSFRRIHKTGNDH